MDYNLLLHIDSKDENVMRMVLRNANNYLNALPQEKFELDIVANGGGVVHFTRGHADFARLVEELAQRGVKFKLCANAMNDHGLTKDMIWPVCQVVPAGLVEIVRLQRSGFAYVKP